MWSQMRNGRVAYNKKKEKKDVFTNKILFLLSWTLILCLFILISTPLSLNSNNE